MSAEEFLLFLHVIAAFWYVIGLSAVQLAYVRAVQSTDLSARAAAVEEASHYQGAALVPGAIAIGATGLFYWASRDYELLETGWLLALEGLYLVTLFVCLPVIGMALRRARLAALRARRDAEAAAALEAALRDNVLLVFGSLATVVLVAMAFISATRPF